MDAKVNKTLTITTPSDLEIAMHACSTRRVIWCSMP
jgi:hypothetical protein